MPALVRALIIKKPCAETMRNVIEWGDFGIIIVNLTEWFYLFSDAKSCKVLYDVRQ